MNESKGRSFFENFPEELKKNFYTNDESFVSYISLSNEEKFFLEQGLLEIEEGNFEPIYKETDQNIKAQQNSLATLKNNEEKIELYLVNSLTKILLPEKDLFAELINDFGGIEGTPDVPKSNFFNNFLDAACKKQDVLFHEYDIPTVKYGKGLPKTKLKPCRIIYKRMIKLICWKDELKKKLYFVGGLSKTIVNPERLLDEIMIERFNRRYSLQSRAEPFEPLAGNLLFYSLEISFKMASTLLGYSHYKLSNLLDDNIISTSGYENRNDNRQKFSRPLQQYYSKRIPLKEIYSYIKETDIEDKDEKIAALRDYIEITREAILSELEINAHKYSYLDKEPYFISLRETNKRLKNENLRLKNENEQFKTEIKDFGNQTNTAKTRTAYINLAIPEIVKIVKNYKENDPLKIEFDNFKKVVEKIKQPDIGVNIKFLKTIFKAIPEKYIAGRGEYNRKREK